MKSSASEPGLSSHKENQEFFWHIQRFEDFVTQKKTILKTSLKLVPSKALEPKTGLTIESVAFNIFGTKRFG